MLFVLIVFSKKILFKILPYFGINSEGYQDASGAIFFYSPTHYGEPMNGERATTILSGAVVLAFTAAAGFFCWFIGSVAANHYRSAGWASVPATVAASDIRTSRSSPGAGAVRTLNSKVVAAYTYQFNGVAYCGSRVDFSIGSDNFSGTRRHAQLSRLRTGQIEVYVNPDRPDESVFDRSFPSGQYVFALVFLAFPCGVGTVFVFGLLSAALEKLGWRGIKRYTFPLLGIFHGAPGLYPLFFAPASLSVFGWLVVSACTALFVWSGAACARRALDPELGEPKWPERMQQKIKIGRSAGRAEGRAINSL